MYCHTNLSNNKKYVGQTTQDPEKRWGPGGKNYRTNLAFNRDIMEYGWDGFSHEILEVVESNNPSVLKQKLDKIEHNYIHKYKSMLHDHGYNTLISRNGTNMKLSQSAKRFISMEMERGVDVVQAYENYKNKKRKRKLRKGGK